MFLYGTIKFNVLVNRVNPSITLAEEPLEVDDQLTLVNLQDETIMRFAFSVRTSDDKQTLLDPRYVKMITRVYTKY